MKATTKNGYTVTTHANPEGYSAGTWEYRIVPTGDPENCMSFDGGFQSEEHALEDGKRRALELQAQ